MKTCRRRQTNHFTNPATAPKSGQSHLYQACPWPSYEEHRLTDYIHADEPGDNRGRIYTSPVLYTPTELNDDVTGATQYIGVSAANNKILLFHILVCLLFLLILFFFRRCSQHVDHTREWPGNSEVFESLARTNVFTGYATKETFFLP